MNGCFARVVAVVVGLENYRKPKSGDALPTVAYAHADAHAVSDALYQIFKDMPEGDVDVEVMTDSDASLTAIKDHLAYTIRNLSAGDLFIFYYAGHGFHGAGGNRLSTYDTNRLNIADTTLSMRDALLEPFADSACEQALVFVDACAEHFRDVVQSRDVIANLDAHEVDEFLDSVGISGLSYPARRARNPFRRASSAMASGRTSYWKHWRGALLMRSQATVG